jgi:hypothetical protein
MSLMTSIARIALRIFTGTTREATDPYRMVRMWVVAPKRRLPADISPDRGKAWLKASPRAQPGVGSARVVKRLPAMEAKAVTAELASDTRDDQTAPGLGGTC